MLAFLDLLFHLLFIESRKRAKLHVERKKYKYAPFRAKHERRHKKHVFRGHADRRNIALRAKRNI